MFAICLRCGATKELPYETCVGCGFQPTEEDESLLKSVYLSLGRYDTPDEQSRYALELVTLAEQLRRGEEIEFDGDDLRRLQKQKGEVEHLSYAGTTYLLFRIFFPGILLLLILIGVLVILKRQ